MRITIKKGWSEKSKQAMLAIVIGVITIIAVVILD